MSRRDDDYPVAADGDVTEIEADSVFHFACCGSEHGGCSLVHDLIFHVAEDGGIEMQVWRNEEETARLRQLDGIANDPRESRRAERRAERAARRAARDSETARPPVFAFVDSAGTTGRSDNPMPTNTPRHRRRTSDAIDPYETIVDSDGRRTRVLRDGAVARVSFFDAAVARGASPEAARAAEAVRITQAVEATRAAMGTGATGNGPLVIGDRQFSDAELAAHRPGWRTSDSLPPWQETDVDDPGGNDDELERHNKRLRRASANAASRYESDPDNPDDDDDGDVDDAVAAAHAEMVADMCDAWKGPAQRRDAQPGEGLPTRSLQVIPPRGGRYPPEAEGQLCDLNGVQGVVRGGVCRPGPAPGPTRSGTAGDTAALQDRATAITSVAYQEYLDQLTNAWRS